MKYRRKDLTVDAFQAGFDDEPKWFELALEVGVAWVADDGQYVLYENDYVPATDYIILGALNEIWHISEEEFNIYYEST